MAMLPSKCHAVTHQEPQTPWSQMTISELAAHICLRLCSDMYDVPSYITKRIKTLRKEDPSWDYALLLQFHIGASLSEQELAEGRLLPNDITTGPAQKMAISIPMVWMGPNPIGIRLLQIDALRKSTERTIHLAHGLIHTDSDSRQTSHLLSKPNGYNLKRPLDLQHKSLPHHALPTPSPSPTPSAKAKQKQAAHFANPRPSDKAHHTEISYIHDVSINIEPSDIVPRISEWRDIAIKEDNHLAHNIRPGKYRKMSAEQALDKAGDCNLLHFIHKHKINGIPQPVVFHRQTDSRPTQGAGAFGVSIPDNLHLDSFLKVPDQAPICVTDVLRQMDVDWSPEEIHEHFSNTFKSTTYPTFPHNIISFECSHLNWGRELDPPDFAIEVDWPTRFAKGRQREAGGAGCLRYFSLSDAGSFSDFHVDFSGSTVFVTLLRGAKTWFLIEPTEANLRANAMFRAGQGFADFAADVGVIHRVKLVQGESMVLPGGWLHAVLTTSPSIMFSSNVIHEYNIPLQIKTWKLETEFGIPDRLHNFVSCCIKAAEDLLHRINDKDVTSISNINRRLPIPNIEDIRLLCNFLTETNVKRSGLRERLPSKAKLKLLIEKLSEAADHLQDE